MHYQSKHEAGKRALRTRRKTFFWKGLGLYAAVLLALALAFLAYTDRCLTAYENAQPDNAMQGFLAEFAAAAEGGTAAQGLTLPAAAADFGLQAEYESLCAQQLESVGEFRFAKSEGSYNTEAPVYDIYGDDALVARMELRATDARTIFGILTIMDWEVAGVTPVLTQGVADYTLWAPQGATVLVNGAAAGESYRTGQTYDDPALTHVKEYVALPLLEEYRFAQLPAQTALAAQSAGGEALACRLQEDGSLLADYAPGGGQDMPEEYAQLAMEIAKTWDDFLTADLTGAGHGLAKVQAYLLWDSYYWNLAQDYAYGIDITFVSDHATANNRYTEEMVDDYRRYADNCFSCHIRFVKTMRLSTGQASQDVVDSTIYFVYFDDSDNGINDPHWAMVDMTATTAG